MSAAERVQRRGHQLFDQYDAGLITAADLALGLRLLKEEAWRLLWDECRAELLEEPMAVAA